ncbi:MULTISPECIES: iron ABC transporter permease [Brevibacillus]|uniref:ABC transporter permease n=1 Tax=Brevibacillus TaxID=55080 RepID=UPI00203DEB47|nr:MULTISPECIES: iron ABC transporter permease [Brevibacillus]MCM3077685.1 iron ABC transporter permease [Brevibacillus invocatus]MCM3428687.1 iron ABC transporter permease [Brevibacillus invocatus]MDH4617425.1 iron ABC transporter permease [Brevibacillus sp. AY1]
MVFKTLLRNIKMNTNGWLFISLIGVAVILLPVFSIFVSLFAEPNENWEHIKQYMLTNYILQSVGLMLFTGILTVMIGVTLAWLIAAYDFPLKRFFHWALVLPLSIPPYIAAYTYSAMLSYTGVVQTALRSTFGFTPDQKWFDIMSFPGAVFIFTLFLYPYVYMLTRSFLERQSGSYVENAILLGRKPVSIFFRIVLPISQPAIIGSLMLVIFEVISDYGVTSYFGIQTISTAIFQTWFGMYDVDTALRLSAWMMAGVLGLFLIERMLRYNRKYSASTSKSSQLVPKRLKGFSSFAALFFCGAVFACSFLIPVIQLIVWSFWTYEDVLTVAFFELTINTLFVAAIATGMIMFLAVVVANVARLQPNRFGTVLSKLMVSGYSLPGAIIAIGVLTFFIALDERMEFVYLLFGYEDAPLLLSMSLVMLIVAYVVRFMATGYNAVEAGFEKVGMVYTHASRTLGYGITRTFFKVDLFLIKGALMGGTILTFVEIIKELPMALLLRPFNFETLSTKTYQYASDERVIEAAIPSLFIITVSVISVLLFHQLGKKMEK